MGYGLVNIIAALVDGLETKRDLTDNERDAMIAYLEDYLKLRERLSGDWSKK